MWLLGSRSESGPALEMVNLMDPRPLIGARSLPVENASRSRFSVSVRECTTDQKLTMRLRASAEGEGIGGRDGKGGWVGVGGGITDEL